MGFWSSSHNINMLKYIGLIIAGAFAIAAELFVEFIPKYNEVSGGVYGADFYTEMASGLAGVENRIMLLVTICRCGFSGILWCAGIAMCSIGISGVLSLRSQKRREANVISNAVAPEQPAAPIANPEPHPSPADETENTDENVAEDATKTPDAELPQAQESKTEN